MSTQTNTHTCGCNGNTFRTPEYRRPGHPVIPTFSGQLHVTSPFSGSLTLNGNFRKMGIELVNSLVVSGEKFASFVSLVVHIFLNF